MKHSTHSGPSRLFSARAPLVALGLWLGHKRLLAPIKERVVIRQKSIKHTPVQKLIDAFIGILAGSRGMVEINKRVRSDRALQIAFGRSACAEQSVVQQTLDACTKENIEQIEQAMDTIYQRHSRGYRHRYTEQLQLLDLDMSGAPCGRKAEFATKGYFARQPNRRGRQLGRVLATRYQEIVVDQLFDGKTQLQTAFIPLVEAAERRLGLDADKRTRTLLRVDAGGGTLDDINWALARGYQYHGKDYSAARARVLAQSVTEWVDDPKVAGRQVGWVSLPEHPYVRPVKRLAVRCPKDNGQWGVGVLLSTLTPEEVVLGCRLPIDRVHDRVAVLLAYAYFYDQRGGGIETSLKEDKQGLGLTKRNKKRFVAQQMLVCLSMLAHNVVVWVRNQLAPQCARLEGMGILRWVRDLLHTNGWIQIGPAGQVSRITLNSDDAMAVLLKRPLRRLLEPLQVSVNLGQT